MRSLRVHRPGLARALFGAPGLALGLLLLGAAPQPASRAGAVHTVRIEGMRYTPATLQVAPGDTVRWENHDLVPHTVSGPHGTFESGDIAAGASWTLQVSSPGAFAYTCRYHPTMKGTLQVLAPGEADPAGCVDAPAPRR